MQNRKDISKAFEITIMNEFDGYLKTFQFKKIDHHTDDDGFLIDYRNGNRYFRFSGQLHQRDFPFWFSLILGEGESTFPESDWNAISLILMIKSLSADDFSKSNEVFSIDALHITTSDIVLKIKAVREYLEKYGASFINNDMGHFRRLRSEQNKNREPYKIMIPQKDGTYKTEYERHSSELREKYSV